MSINAYHSLEPPEDVVSINFDEIPSLLGLHSFSSEHILHPEKVDFFARILTDINAKCESFLGEFMLDSRDYERYYAMMLELVRPYLQEIYEKHKVELARMIMHISGEMIQDKRKFLPFFILQMFLLQKDLKRNEPISKKILAAKNPDEIDIDEIHRHLRRDAQGSLFIDSNYTCAFDTPHPDNSLPSGLRLGKLRYTRRFYSWPTEKMIGYGVPEFGKAIKTQLRLDEHIDNTLSVHDKTFAAAFYHILRMAPDDPPESMIYMGDHMVFDNRGPDQNEHPKLIVVMERDIGRRELDAFKSLLAARKLACYPSIIRLFTRPQYHYLWRLIIQENPDLCKKIRSYPLSKPGIFFRKIFDAESIDMMTRSDKPVENKASEELPLFIEESWGWTLPPRSEVEVLERKRDELNRKITAILNRHISVRKPAQELQTLTREVAQIHRRIAELASAVFEEGRFLSALDIHQMKRIELDMALIDISNRTTTQPTFIDCSLLLENNCPIGMKISVARKLPGEKDFSPLHVDIGMPENGQIPLPEAALKHNGKIVYRVIFIAPEGGEFEINTNTKTITLETVSLRKPSEPFVSVPKPPELTPAQKKSQMDNRKSKTGKREIDTTSAQVESIIDPKAASLLAVACILLEKAEQYKSDNAYTGGAVVIKISEQDAREVLGDEAHTLIDDHREWIIQEDEAISPEPDADVRAGLLSIAHSLREKAQKKIQQQEEQRQKEQVDQEYREARKEFAPLFDFIRGFRFEGREGDLEKQRDTLREQLKDYGWSIPGSFAGGVIWRHMTGYIRILYPTKQCNSSSIEAEPRGVLTSALQKCYEEIAEAGAHIARFFNAENRDRTRMIRRERAMTKEIQTGAEAYDKLLDKGQARLVLFGTYQQSHGLWSSKFPTEERPFMLDERVSHETIGSILAQNPGAELCYRRDQLCLNGEIGEDAGEESVENTLQNITELRNSPRARYILRKRILITLGLERFSGDTARAPIKHEKGKKEHSHSALDILQYLSLMWCRAKDILNTCDTSDICQHIRQEGYGYDKFDHSSVDEKKSAGVFYQMRHIFEENTTVTLSANDIDKNFIDAYIDCLELLKIRVHYVWPISVSLDEHQKLVKKAQ